MLLQLILMALLHSFHYFFCPRRLQKRLDQFVSYELLFILLENWLDLSHYLLTISINSLINSRTEIDVPFLDKWLASTSVSHHVYHGDDYLNAKEAAYDNGQT